MPATVDELESFSRFAAQRLRQGDQLPSLEECLRQWREESEREELLAEIQAGLDDVEQGRGQPVDEAFADIRQQLGWTR